MAMHSTELCAVLRLCCPMSVSPLCQGQRPSSAALPSTSAPLLNSTGSNRRAEFGPKYGKDLNGWFETPGQERDFWKVTKGCEIAKGLSCLNHCSSSIKKGINSFQFLVDLSCQFLSFHSLWCDSSFLWCKWIIFSLILKRPFPSTPPPEKHCSNQTLTKHWFWLIVDITHSPQWSISYTFFKTSV